MKYYDKTIGCLALLESEMMGTDYISAYIPFLATVLLNLSANNHHLTLEPICDKFYELYGFKIDREPMISILNKCKTKNLLTNKNGIYKVNKKECIELQISNDKIKIESDKYKTVFLDFRKFAKEKYNKDYDNDDAILNIFLSFLDQNSARTLKGEFSQRGKYHKKDEYILASYIRYVNEYNNDIMDKIRKILIGYLMSSAIAYGSNDETVKIDGMKELCVFLDTPLIFRLLGIDGSSIKDSLELLLNRLKEYKCSIYIFSHTYDEVVRVLDGCIKWINSEEYREDIASPALRYYKANSFTQTKILAVKNGLKSILEKNNIRIDDNEDVFYNQNVEKFEAEVLTEKILNCYKNTGLKTNEYKVNQQIDHDVESIKRVLILRKQNAKKKNFTTYRQAKYIFVTSNSSLSSEVRNYCCGIYHNIKQYHTYPCVTDVFLGTMLWLGAPIKDLNNYARIKLVADCMAMLSPSELMLHRFYEYITKKYDEKKIDKKDYFMLRAGMYDHDYFMDNTLGDEDTFSEELLTDLVEKEINKHTQGIREKLSETIAERDKLLNDKNKRDNEEYDIQKCGYTIFEKIKKLFISCIVLPLANVVLAISGKTEMSNLLFGICCVLIAVIPYLSYKLQQEDSLCTRKLKSFIIKIIKILKICHS